MTWAASSSTDSITGGLAVVGLGLFIGLIDRLDVGRFTRRYFERVYARRRGAAEARNLLGGIRRWDRWFATVVGSICIVAGSVVTVAGVVSAIG